MSKDINIFISFDMEGVSVVSSWKEMRRDSPSLRDVRKCATEEVNAAIKGIKNTKFSIGEIVVCDAHADGENLLVDQLERGVSIIRGSPRNYYMVEGINENFDLLFFIGYHAMAGTQRAGMDHTYSSSQIYNIKINGQNVGESEINAAIAGYYDVPLGLVSGDDLLIKEVKRFFDARVETVVTKYGISRYAAKCRHHMDVQHEIEIKAAKAVKKMNALKPFKFASPIKAEFEVMNSCIGDLVAPIPELKRMSARGFKINTKNILEFYQVLRLIYRIGIQ